MNSEVPVIRRTVKAEVYPKRYRCPCWILLPTVKAYLWREMSANTSKTSHGAYLVRWFCLEFFEDLVRLNLRRKSAHIAADLKESIEY